MNPSSIKLSSITLTYDRVHMPETCCIFIDGELHVKIKIHPIHGLMAIRPAYMGPAPLKILDLSGKLSFPFRAFVNKSFYYLSKPI